MDAADLVLVLVALVAIERDLRTGQIPNRIALLGAVGGVGAAIWASGGLGLLRSALAAAVVGALLWPVWRAGHLGGGDIKIACALAAIKGLMFAYCMLFYGSILAAIGAIVLAIRSRRLHPISVPLGAALAVGALWTLAEARTNCTLIDLILPS